MITVAAALITSDTAMDSSLSNPENLTVYTSLSKMLPLLPMPGLYIHVHEGFR